MVNLISDGEQSEVANLPGIIIPVVIGIIVVVLIMIIIFVIWRKKLAKSKSSLSFTVVPVHVDQSLQFGVF